MIIFDLDGTLADGKHREHHIKDGKSDWDAYFAACGQDEPIKPTLDIFKALTHARHVEVWTGRPERYRDTTLDGMVRMRPDGTPGSSNMASGQAAGRVL